MSQIFNQDFQDFLTAFEDANVEYVLVGGYSVIIHGYNRTTGDMDLLVNPTSDNYSKIKVAFKHFGMPLFGMTLEKFLDSENFDVFEYGRPPVSIDIITKIKGVSYIEASENAIRYKISDDLTINVIQVL